MTAYTVQIGTSIVRAYNDAELVALLEARKLYYGEKNILCRKALRGLAILMQRHVSSIVVKTIDKQLAEMIRRGECHDI